ncbi:MAG: cell division protein SepF [Candidatus Sericytochromatia bacterium]|nr:cell division protein SepF [Candidatus Sericytochromatia bacterium]
MSADVWTKVKTFVGLQDEYEDEHHVPHEAIEEPAADTRRRAGRPAVVPGGRNDNIIGLNPSVQNNEMVIVEPRSFDDALAVVEALRNRRAVIINLTGLDTEQAQRLIDFVSGATHAIDGNQERVGEGIFLFTPSNVVINSLQTEQPWLNKDARDLFWRVK